MGTTLIFVGQRMVTNAVSSQSLLDWAGCDGVPGNSLRMKTVPETDTGGQVE